MKKLLATIMIIAMLGLLGFAGYRIYYAKKDLDATRRQVEYAEKFGKDLKERFERQAIKVKELVIEIETREKYIREAEKEIRRLEKSIAPTYFVKKTFSSKVLANKAFEQVIELEPKGENTIPVLSVIIQTQDGTRIKSLKVEGEALPAKVEKEENKTQTMSRVIYRSVKPAPVKITIIAEKNTALDVIIDPYREL